MLPERSDPPAGAERTDEENDDRKGPPLFMGRRDAVKRIGAVGVLAALGTIGLFQRTAAPVLAASGHESWVAESAEVTAHDGSVDALTFGDTGDEDDELHLSWSGLNDDDRDVNFRILVKGTDGGDGGDWTGGTLATSETSYEELASATPGVTLGSTSGADDYSWNEVFGDEQPVDVDEHSEIDVSADFSAESDGSERVRELAVDVEVWIDEEDGEHGPSEDALGDRQEATATITVTNAAAEIDIGGQGTFDLSSDEEVD